MPARRLLLVAAAVLAAMPAQTDSPSGLRVESSAAVAVIKPVPESRRLIQLPALKYDLRVAAACEAGQHENTVSISIADTNRTVDGSTFSDGGAVDIELIVPGRQSSPVVVDGFCRDSGESDTSPEIARIEGAVTAHLSLRCAGEDQDSIVYASEPLNVTLQCERDQPSSESSATR